MSLINDALNKAQRERGQPRGSTLYRTPGYRPGHLRPLPVKSLRFIWINTAVVAGLCLAALVYLRVRSLKPAAPNVTLASNFEAPGSAMADGRPHAASETFDGGSAPRMNPETATSSAENSLLPTASVPPPLTRSDYQLAGMSAIGAETLLSITRVSDRRSLWVPLGKTVGEITAVSYDPATDRAVIRVNGSLQTIALRDAGPPAAAVSSVSE